MDDIRAYTWTKNFHFEKKYRGSRKIGLILIRPLNRQYLRFIIPFIKRNIKYLLYLSPNLMDPISLSQLSITQIFKDKPNSNQEQHMKKSKNKNRKKHGKKNSNSNLEGQNRPQQLFQLQSLTPSHDISQNQHLIQTSKNLNENSQLGSFGDRNQQKSLISHGTNYSTQKSLSNQRRESFSQTEESEEQIQIPLVRKERSTLHERSNPKKLEQNDPPNKEETTSRQLVSGGLQVVANNCNEMERECGSTYRVRESNSHHEGFNGSQKIIDTSDVSNPFNPGGHNSGPSQESRQGGEMVENHRISLINQTVQNDRQITPRNNRNIGQTLFRLLATIHILAAAAEKVKWFSGGGAKSLKVLPQVKRGAWQRGKKFQRSLRIISFNVDTYFQERDTKHEGKYYGTSEKQRIKEIIVLLLMLMKEGVDVILLQEVTSETMRRQLHNLLKTFNSDSRNGEKYRYPERLESVKEEVTTMILSKHDVRLGSFEFDIQDPRYKTEKRMPLSMQSFCEIDMEINGKKQTVCIFNCHLISNSSQLEPNVVRRIRLQQLDAITQFLTRYSRKFLIGDTNIGESETFSEQNKYLGERYNDAVNYGLSEVRGTYLFEIRHEDRVIEERLDRVMVDKEHASSTSITIKYRDFYLEAAKGKGMDRKQMLIEYEKFYQFITLSDHTLLDANITFYG